MLRLYMAVIDPSWVYAAEITFDCPMYLNNLMEKVQLNLFRRILGVQKRSHKIGTLAEFGAVTPEKRRFWLATKFFNYAAACSDDSLVKDALLDSIDLHDKKKKGWYHNLATRLEKWRFFINVESEPRDNTYMKLSKMMTEVYLKRIRY